ncbi:YcnI family copper-binding membrane protein [Nocardia stercoris]|uniref:DUF1775 domain-containing protein n=1 Tax=Nocardia stercoris TaxID=2483361 RepID=A0A3M2L9B2_9NOCA|nr:YcnI family protein [Nocardia stercoris]RMI34157.1 DUF1775 domain-containing protein [Nocardia stercoris]
MSLVVSRALMASAAVAGLTVLAAGTAAAHVTADAPGATQGGYGVVTFKVPTESTGATTTQVSVVLPNVASARTEPIAGWTAKLDKNDKNEFTGVTWSANPGNPGIGVDQFQRFVVSVSLPKQDKVSFPATQTYSDGKVVKWDEPQTGSQEPEHPAPTIALAAAKGGSDDGDGDGMNSAAPAAHDSDDTTARWLGGIGLALGALGAALGLGSVIRRRS